MRPIPKYYQETLVYCHLKQVQYEVAEDALVAKQEQLGELVESEQDAGGLGGTLVRGRV
jgi:hypothetical protein